MSLLARVIPDNPVLTKEMRVRMRGARAYWILLGYLGFLSLVLLLNYASWLTQVQMRGGGASEASRIGSDLFNWILVTQVFLVLFITPAITSGSVTIEKEQRTLEMLTMTRLKRRSIVAGKLLAALLFTSLLLVSSLPLVSICFMLGSVDPAMVAGAYVLLLAGSFLVGALGLMWSSVAKTTAAAVLYTYASLIFPVIFGWITFFSARYPASDLAMTFFRSVGESWFGGRFMGLPMPTGTGFVVLALLGGWLFAAMAVSRLETWPEKRAPLLRGLTALLFGVQAFSATLWWALAWYSRGAGAVQTVVPPPIAALILPVSLLMILVPIFATGELHPSEARDFGRTLRQGWSRLGLKRGKLSSGLPFLLLLTLFALGLHMLAFALTGHAGDISRSGAAANPILPAPPPPGGTAGAPPAPAVSSLAGDFPQAALVTLASVGGFALLCFLMSVMFRNRWVAMGLAYLFLLAVWIAPEIARAGTYGGAPPGFSINLYYFNPATAIVEMTSAPDSFWSNRLLLLDRTPMWQASTFLWLFVGAVSLALLLPFAHRIARDTAPVRFEEMAQAD